MNQDKFARAERQKQDKMEAGPPDNSKDYVVYARIWVDLSDTDEDSASDAVSAMLARLDFEGKINGFEIEEVEEA